VSGAYPLMVRHCVGRLENPANQSKRGANENAITVTLDT
jgi:hypothetical protein